MTVCCWCSTGSNNISTVAHARTTQTLTLVAIIKPVNDDSRPRRRRLPQLQRKMIWAYYGERENRTFRKYVHKFSWKLKHFCIQFLAKIYNLLFIVYLFLKVYKKSLLYHILRRNLSFTVLPLTLLLFSTLMTFDRFFLVETFTGKMAVAQPTGQTVDTCWFWTARCIYSCNAWMFDKRCQFLSVRLSRSYGAWIAKGYLQTFFCLTIFQCLVFCQNECTSKNLKPGLLIEGNFSKLSTVFLTGSVS